MLSTPNGGWCYVSVGSWIDRGSYLVDIPIELLKAVESVMLTGAPEAVYFDAEGWEYVIELFDDYMRISTESPDHEVSTRTFNLGAKDIAPELISDIRRDLEEWVMWPPYSDEPWFDADERREELNTYCDMIETLLPKTFS